MFTYSSEFTMLQFTVHQMTEINVWSCCLWISNLGLWNFLWKSIILKMDLNFPIITLLKDCLRAESKPRCSTFFSEYQHIKLFLLFKKNFQGFSRICLNANKCYSYLFFLYNSKIFSTTVKMSHCNIKIYDLWIFSQLNVANICKTWLTNFIEIHPYPFVLSLIFQNLVLSHSKLSV